MTNLDPIPGFKRDVAAEVTKALGGCQTATAEAILGTNRFRIAEIRSGKLDRFSLETLIRFLTRTGQHVELRVTPPSAIDG